MIFRSGFESTRFVGGHSINVNEDNSDIRSVNRKRLQCKGNFNILQNFLDRQMLIRLNRYHVRTVGQWNLHS